MAGLILAAPASACGKTTLTLGLLRAIKNRNIPIRSAKSGPDYIDPGFHAAASGTECINLDAWAMHPNTIRGLAAGGPTLIVEGAMGLFDGAPPLAKGATADLARILDLPVVLILDVSHQAQSAAALVEGFARYDPAIHIAGLILNKVGSTRHERIIHAALEPLGIPILGAIHRQTSLQTPSRHLGLVQAGEHPNLDTFLNQAAQIAENGINIDALLALATEQTAPNGTPRTIAPPAQRLAIASDTAFAFCYPHLLNSWRANGAEIQTFSPLANEAPPQCDLVILPGGYPELYAGKLASNTTFLDGLRSAPAIYGECGGYMALGDGLIDSGGERHRMAGLLRLETSFADRCLHLGYRNLIPKGGPWNIPLKAHEFHYAHTLKATGEPLFSATDAEGNTLGDMGLRNGEIAGSFAHIIEQAL